MSYLQEARERAEKIRYLRDHSQINALRQAEFQLGEMSELARRAERSKTGQKSLPVILELMRTSRELVADIRSRENPEEGAGLDA